MNNPFAPFLIRIYSQDGNIIGTGFLVSDRHALTCWHVIADGHPNGDRYAAATPTFEITFDFPLPSPSQRLRARIVGGVPMSSAEPLQPSGNEDIALLEILDEVPREYRAAVMASTDVASGSPFRTFGFSQEKGVPADGITKDAISEGCVVIQDTKAIGYFVESGFSGAPVWSNDAVIGMIVRGDEEKRTAYMIPSTLLLQACFQKLCPLSEGLARSLVQGLTIIPADQWHQAYANNRLSDAAWPPNVWLAAWQLFQLNDPQRGLRFVAELGENFPHSNLTKWAQRANEGRKVSILKSGSRAQTTTLLFQIDPLPSPPDKFYLHAWLWQEEMPSELTNSEQVPRDWDTIADEVQGWITWQRSQCADFVIELVLPRAVFCCDITQWEMNPGETVLRQLPVFFRCQKRFLARRQEMKDATFGVGQLELQRRALAMRKGPPPVLLKDWEKKCLQLQDKSQNTALSMLYHLDSQRNILDLLDDFSNEQGLFVAFGCKPDSSNELSVFWRALDYGAPLVIWFREHPIGDLDTKQALLDALSLENQEEQIKLGDLPKHIWELQKTALKKKDRNNAHHHLTILYDDFERVPAPK
jgi:vWA-MoxR associated protein C-terminal domain/Trypsin-like peptidase domain